MRSLILLTLTIAACSYDPSFYPCRIACTTDTGCPSGESCQDGLCHTEGAVCADGNGSGDGNSDGNGNGNSDASSTTWDGIYMLAQDSDSPCLQSAQVWQFIEISSVDDDGTGTARFWTTTEVVPPAIAARNTNRTLTISSVDTQFLKLGAWIVTQDSPGIFKGTVTVNGTCDAKLTATKK
jgi:hypothetical protein